MISGEPAARVPFNDLSRSIALRTEELLSVVERVVRSGWFLLGPETEAFESDFAEYCGASGCIGVGNGTDALELALRSVGCDRGDEVIVPANAGGYATTACVAIGATPVFAELSADSLLVNPEQISAVVSDRTRAIVATHLYGNVVDIDELRGLLPDTVAIVEDCAQAHGARLRDRPVGSLGDVAAFSFYPTKNLGAFGDAGAVVSSDADVLLRLRTLHQYGWTERYRATVTGGRNTRIDELQAALLRVLLQDLNANNDRRQSIRSTYVARLGGRVSFPSRVSADAQPVVHLCVIRSSERDRMIVDLNNLGVSTAVHYPVPDHWQVAWDGIGVQRTDLSETERACSEVLSLPCFPGMSDEEVEQVVTAVEQVT